MLFLTSNNINFEIKLAFQQNFDTDKAHISSESENFMK